MTQPNYIITTRKIKAQYEHFMRVTAARDRELGIATDILRSTSWWRWRDRHRRKYARHVIRSAVRRGLTRWYVADPFVWPPPGEVQPAAVSDLASLVGAPPPGAFDSPFWRSFKSESDDDVVQ